MKTNNMSRPFFFFAIFCGLTSELIAQTAPSETVLDLSAAQRYALGHNYGIQALQHERDEIQYRSRSRLGAYFPRIGVAGGGEWEKAKAESQSGSIGYLYGSYNLFNGFKDVQQRDMVLVEAAIVEARLKSAQFLLGLEVEEFFHTYLYKLALIGLKDGEITLNEKHQKSVEQTRSRGSSSEADVMEFEYKGANLRSELVSLRQELEDARSNLKRLLGEEIGGNIRPIGDLQHQHIKSTLQDLLAKIQTNASAVHIKVKEIDLAKAEQKAARGDFLPQIDLEVRGGYLPLADRIKEDEPQTSVALVAKMDLFSGGKSFAETSEKASKVLRQEALLKEELNTAIRRVEGGYRSLKVIERRADLEKENVSFSKRYYDAVLQEYLRGFKNSYDLGTAADRYSESMRRKLDLEFDFLKQRIEIEKNLGATVEVEVVTSQPKEQERKGGK